MIEYIKHVIAERGYPPTVREIAAHVGISTSTVHARLKQLEAEGLIRVEPGMARAITIMEPGEKQ